MPHLRLEVPVEWLNEEFRATTGFDAAKLLSALVRVIANFRMPNPAGDGLPEVALINLSNLKHAVIPLYSAGIGDASGQRFLHITFAAGNDTPGRTAEVRCRVAEALGRAADEFTAGLPELGSLTVHVQDIDRSRGYSTTSERKKKRE